jgi:hypothetical protein
VRTQGTTEVKDEADRGSRAEHLHGDADQQSECAGGQQDAERNHPSPTSSPSRADIRSIRSVDSDAVVETLRARTGLRGPPRWRPRPAWFSYHHLQACDHCNCIQVSMHVLVLLRPFRVIAGSLQT